MRKSRLSLPTRLLLVLGALSWGTDPGICAAATQAQSSEAKTGTKAKGPQQKITDVAGRTHTIPVRVTPAERQAAADRLKAKIAATRAAAGAAAAVPTAAALPPAGGYLVGPNKQLIPDYSGLTPNWAYSPLLTKFKDPLPLLYISGISPTTNTGQYIPVAQPRTFPVGCGVTGQPACQNVDYYEIELAEYSTWSFHSEMPKTKLRGYRQTNAIDPLVGVQSYLGPVILAQKGKPVRVKFTNNLPAGAGGNLYIPVDTTVMGSGPGPNVTDAIRQAIPADQLCMPDQVTGVIPAGCYTQNRATLHLHGGVTPWISDGTTHQWITPGNENTAYPKGVSVYNVPDMANPGKPPSTNAADPSRGVQTFYWTNDQSSRLMFYHDHASGITRLNVYAGEAAGYLLRDSAEIGLEQQGLIPGLLENIPLVLQEKAFVDAATIAATDPTWNWGTGAVSTYTDSLGNTMNQRAPVTGDLWWPHVYQPAQNPSDLSGYNAVGRWNYGPWFFPPTPIPYPPKLNPYTGPGQPYEIPGTPNPSWGAEAFLDTPVINGAAYPTLTVQAKPYRFRILNAGGDRFFNLQLYLAADKNSPTTAGTTGAVMCDGGATVALTDCTEVKMVPAGAGLPENYPKDGRDGGVPDPAFEGPSFFMIGSEGGFLPMPVEVKPQPVVWNGDPLTFNFGNVSDFSLLLGPAERADAIVDFTNLDGKTFILYNDAPAAFPASDPRNDYYTGNPDQTDTGGTIPTLPGQGPNTRTLMQIHVVAAAAPGITFDPVALAAAFTTDPQAAPPTVGVFKASQDEIVVGQSAYDAAYGKTFPSTYPWWGLGTIFNSNLSFQTVGGANVTMLAKEKAIHDEMGATFDDYGRMRASLGVAMPNPTPNTANFIMQAYADPATELVKLVSTPIGSPLADGTQIWRVNHNGVDTHPIHFHLFSVQLVNRVGWDGAYRLPHPTELGWKDTVRISPLEDTYVALRPITPKASTLPFKLPNSVHPLEPALPIGSTMGFTNIDPLGNPIVPGLTNQNANFGWEYVWHCHILSHEENDMMRAVVFAATPETPTFNTANRNGAPVNLAWTDNSLTATSFTIQRDTVNTFTSAALTTFTIGAPACTNNAGCPRTYTDTSSVVGPSYYYRVLASNTVGSGVINYPTITADSLWSNVVAALSGPVAGVTPASLAFGNQAVNTTSAPRTVTLSNTGGGQLTFTIGFTGTNAANFAQTNSCGGVVAAGAACVISVTFRPTATGARTATMNIATNDPAHATLPVTLTGTGTAVVANQVRVGGLTGARNRAGAFWTATVTITARNGTNALVGNVRVTGSWTGGLGGSTACTTNNNAASPNFGRCSVTRTVASASGSATYSVTNMTRTGYTYVPAANVPNPPTITVR